MQGVNRAIYFAPWAWDLEMFIMRLIVLSPFRCEECRTYLFTNMFVPDTRTRDEELGDFGPNTSPYTQLETKHVEKCILMLEYIYEI